MFSLASVRGCDCVHQIKTPFSDNYNYIEAGERRFRWQGCPEGGCSYELAIQLMITMVGKQIFNNCVEFLFPWLMRKVSKCRKVSYHTFTRKSHIIDLDVGCARR